MNVVYQFTIYMLVAITTSLYFQVRRLEKSVANLEQRLGIPPQ